MNKFPLRNPQTTKREDISSCGISRDALGWINPLQHVARHYFHAVKHAPWIQPRVTEEEEEVEKEEEGQNQRHRKGKKRETNRKRETK
ncbi:hypothetical protein M0804_008911 [Polistes exclamans]|nr:hypothetical protein M0804_008911 [Polistes exclamans]